MTGAPGSEPSSWRSAMRPTQILALAAAVPLLAASASAQDPFGEVSLFGEEEFTIQAATKTELPISKAPGSVTVISAQQIRESAARTIPELLRMVAGVNVRWNPMVQTLDVRSFGQNPFTSRVLLLIDGVPYNSWNKGGFPQHPGFDFFILQNVKRIEIVRGPGSSLYGENAYWGVVNIVSLSGEDLQGGKVEAFGGDLLNESLGAVYGKGYDNGSFLLSGKVTRGQFPIGFWGEDGADSRVEGGDLFFKGKYKGFEVSYYRHEDDVEGYGIGQTAPPPVFRSAEEISQTVEILATKYQHEWDNGVSFGADLSYASRDGSRCASCHAAGQSPAFSETVDHGSQLIGDFRVGLNMIPSHDILIGVEAREVDTGDHVDELLNPAASEVPVVFDYTKLAAYVQDQISLADDRLRLTLGARYDDSNDLFDSEVSPRIAAVWTPTDNVVLRGGWSTAYRYPNFSELYQASWFFNLDFGTFINPLSNFVPNPSLQPEQIRTFDVGAEFRPSEDVSIKFDLFSSELEDFIVIASVEGGIQFVNHPDDAEIFGGEVEFRWKPARTFNVLFNYGYQEADQKGSLVDAGGRTFEFVYGPENKANLGLYLGPFAGVKGTIEAQYRDERLAPGQWNFADPARSTATLDEYTVVNVKLSYEPPVRLGAAERGLRFSLIGKNVFDEEYVETLLPIDMQLPLSTWYGAVELSF